MATSDHGRLLLDLADDPETIDPQVLPRVILAVVKESYKDLKCIQDQLNNIDNRVKELEKIRVENPSIIWLLRHRPRETVPVIVGIFTLVGLLYHSIPFDVLLRYIGL